MVKGGGMDMGIDDLLIGEDGQVALK